MALIKPKEKSKVDYREKNVTLDNELWRALAEYAQVVGIKGRIADKQNYIISEALKRVFAEEEYIKLRDERRNAEKSKTKAAPKKAAAKK